MTLRARLVVAAVMVLAVIAATGFVIVETVSSSQLRQVDQQLSAALPAALSFGQPPILGLPRTRPALTQREDVNGIYIALISHGRRSVLLSPLLTKGEAPRVPPVAQTPRIGKLAPQSVSSETGSSRWRAVLLQSPRSSNNVLIAVSLTGVDTTASRLRWSVLGAGLIVLVVLLSGGFWVERLGLRPIAEVANVADSIVAGDRSRRVTNSASGTEAAHLADAFNVMLDEQHATEDRLRQFLADASHELRTPVTVIRGLADMWASGDLREGPDLADGMRRIGQEAARMSRLVQELLLLARLDSGPPLDAVPVDMRELINNAISIAAATHPNRSVTSAIAGSGIVEGDEEALGQVIRNLIANALTHTSPTSPIEVRFANADGFAILEIIDGGPGMEPECAKHAFDRFWRGENARTRPGTGLGLSIVAAIVSAHGGAVSMKTDPASGTTVGICLPNGRSLRATSASPRTFDKGSATQSASARP